MHVTILLVLIEYSWVRHISVLSFCTSYIQSVKECTWSCHPHLTQAGAPPTQNNNCQVKGPHPCIWCAGILSCARVHMYVHACSTMTHTKTMDFNVLQDYQGTVSIGFCLPKWGMSCFFFKPSHVLCLCTNVQMLVCLCRVCVLVILVSVVLCKRPFGGKYI